VSGESTVVDVEINKGEIAKEDDANEVILWNAKDIREDRAKKATGEQK
jgi:hypothetical protein